jgi:hypothetical protein
MLNRVFCAWLTNFFLNSEKHPLYLNNIPKPILLYGSEIWGYENIKIIEQVHLGFCKRILKVRYSTPNFMVCGELGRYPLEIKKNLQLL